MTFQPVEPPPPQRPDLRPSNTKRGCMIGCGVVFLLLVIAAVLLGLFAKNAYDDVVNGDSGDDRPTVTTNANARLASDAEYAQLVSGHGATLSSQADAISKRCKNVVSDKAGCKSAINAMHTELEATQSDLATVKPPADLANSDAKLRDSVADGLKGTGDVSKGLDNHPLTFAKGLVEVTKAATELREAETQLNQDLANTNAA